MLVAPSSLFVGCIEGLYVYHTREYCFSCTSFATRPQSLVAVDQAPYLCISPLHAYCLIRRGLFHNLILCDEVMSMQLGYVTICPRVSEESEIGCCEIRGEMAINAQMSDNTSASAVISGVAKQSDILKTAQKSMYPISAPSNEVSSLRQQLVALSTRLEKIEAQCPKIPSCSTHVLSSNQNLRSEDHLLQLLLINLHPLLLCLVYTRLSSLQPQPNQNLSYKIAIFCGCPLLLQVSVLPCHWIAAVLYLL